MYVGTGVQIGAILKDKDWIGRLIVVAGMWNSGRNGRQRSTKKKGTSRGVQGKETKKIYRDTDFNFKRWRARFIWILGVQQFVLFALGDVSSLFLTNSDCLSKRIQLICTLGVQELSCCVFG